MKERGEGGEEEGEGEGGPGSSVFRRTKQCVLKFCLEFLLMQYNCLKLAALVYCSFAKAYVLYCPVAEK